MWKASEFWAKVLPPNVSWMKIVNSHGPYLPAEVKLPNVQIYHLPKQKNRKKQLEKHVNPQKVVFSKYHLFCQLVVNLGGYQDRKSRKKTAYFFQTQGNSRSRIHVCVFWFIVAPQRHPKVVKCSNARLFPDITGIHFVVGQALKIKSSSQSPIQETQICRSLYCLEIALTQKMSPQGWHHMFTIQNLENPFLNLHWNKKLGGMVFSSTPSINCWQGTKDIDKILMEIPKCLDTTSWQHMREFSSGRLAQKVDP